MIKTKGLGAVRRKLDEVLRKHIQEAAKAGLDAAGNVVMNDSQERVPVLSGNLKSTGYVARAEVSGSKATGEIGYGTDYAIVQHEDLSLTHTNGQPKFLENSANSSRRAAADAAAKEASLAFKRGTNLVAKEHPETPTRGEDE